MDRSSAVLMGKPQCECTTPLGLPLVPEVNISRNGASAEVHKGLHLRFAFGNAFQTGANQVHGFEFAAAEQKGGLPGGELMDRGGARVHVREYLFFCVQAFTQRHLRYRLR